MIESPIHKEDATQYDWDEAAFARIASARTVLSAIQCDAVGAADEDPRMRSHVHGELAQAAEVLLEDAEAYSIKARQLEREYQGKRETRPQRCSPAS